MRKHSWLIALLAGVLLGVGAPAAHAYSVTSWTAGLYSGDYTGPSDTDFYTQSGGHPFEGVTDFTLDTGGSTTQSVRVDLPPGLVSNPQGFRSAATVSSRSARPTLSWESSSCRSR